jgi:hypothetical protein
MGASSSCAAFFGSTLIRFAERPMDGDPGPICSRPGGDVVLGQSLGAAASRARWDAADLEQILQLAEAFRLLAA